MNTLLTLHDPAAAGRYYDEGVWQPDTFYSLVVRHAAARPAGFALRDAQRRLSYAQLLHWVDALAADLHQAGVRRGQRVSVWLPNCVESVVIFLAWSRNGYICNPSLHQNYTVAEITALLTRLQSAVLFAQPGYGADAAQTDVFAAVQELAFVQKFYRLLPATAIANAPRPGFPELNAAALTAAPAADRNPDKVTYLAFTSGTTGDPKGVMHSDNTLLTNARAMGKDWRHDHRTELLSLSPLSHHIAWVPLAQTLVAGMELVTNTPPAGSSALDWIIETGATYVMGVPTHAIDILAELQRRGISRLGSVKIFYMAGAPIPPDTARAFLNIGITPQNIYGMTENSSHQYTLPDDDAETIVGTCGRAGFGYEIKIWRQDNRDIAAAAGEIGEIGGRGGCLMLGYFDNQNATEQSFNADGWFMSGDLGRLDANGCLHIMGRIKDLIIRGGHNIHPGKIEALAMRHPQVGKAAAIAVADHRLGEKVCLAIIPDGDVPEAAALLAHLQREGLSKYDMPEYFIALKSFPLTASGKILKRELAQWIKQGRIAPQPVRWEPMPPHPSPLPPHPSPLPQGGEGTV
jgi:acyl-CoA synthetase